MPEKEKEGLISMYNVLICDDQPDIVNALKIYLSPRATGC